MRINDIQSQTKKEIHLC